MWFEEIINACDSNIFREVPCLRDTTPLDYSFFSKLLLSSLCCLQQTTTICIACVAKSRDFNFAQNERTRDGVQVSVEDRLITGRSCFCVFLTLSKSNYFKLMHKYCQKMCDLFRYFISYCFGNSKYTVTKGFCRTCTRLSNKPWSYMVVYSFVNGRMHTFVPYSGGNGFPDCLRFTFSNVLSDIDCCDRFVLICTAL